MQYRLLSHVHSHWRVPEPELRTCVFRLQVTDTQLPENTRIGTTHMRAQSSGDENTQLPEETRTAVKLYPSQKNVSVRTCLILILLSLQVVTELQKTTTLNTLLTILYPVPGYTHSVLSLNESTRTTLTLEAAGKPAKGTNINCSKNITVY